MSTVDDHWPYDQPRNCATFTMRQILERAEPILLVRHDEEDHGWQFIGNTDANMSDCRLVCLSHIVELDASVLEVADLLPGWQAVREYPGAPWNRRETPPESDDC